MAFVWFYSFSIFAHTKNCVRELFETWYHHAIIRAAFVCVCMCLCVPYLLRGPLTDLRQTWWVYVGGPPICPWGFFFEKVNGSTGQLVTFTFHYIIYASASRHTLQRHLLLCCWQAAESNSAPFAALHLSAVCRCTSQLPLRGSFSKRSTGRWVDGSTGQTGHISTVYVGGPRNCLEGSFSKRSTGQRVNGSTHQRVKWVDGSTDHFHYIIYDSRRRQAHATPLQKAHSVWWHQAHATPLQKAHSVFCSLDG